MNYGAFLADKIDRKFAADNNEDGKRTHLGGSVIGRKCMREVWFSFRWADHEEFDGRMLRLFNRGHREEPVFVALLRSLGAEVWTGHADGSQYRVAFHGGHGGGAIDGVARGLPGLPPEVPFGAMVLLEMKTHNDKRFKQLVKEGLKAAKPEHYKQCNIYGGQLGLEWCLYCAVNKNDDTLYFEFFALDPSQGVQLVNRAETIIFGEGMPPRISESPSWFECKFCAMHGVCFKTKLPDVNCRTCRFSKPERDGSWTCAHNYLNIKTTPKQGCGVHQFIPEFSQEPC